MRRVHGRGCAMKPACTRQSDSRRLLRQVLYRWFSWWEVLFIGAQLMVLAFSPSSYRKEPRATVLQQIYLAAGPSLPGFTILMAIFNVVVIRIMVVTAFAYGLSSFALQAIVRVLVLELIPLVAALYVAINYSVPGASEIYATEWHSRAAGAVRHPLSYEVLPRVIASVFAVLLLAAVSCIVSLLLAYVAIYGFTLAGAPAYNRAVGHIFDPAVTLIFVLKTGLFALSVAVLPVANALRHFASTASRTRVELRGLMQMFSLLFLIEIASLVGNYQ